MLKDFAKMRILPLHYCTDCYQREVINKRHALKLCKIGKFAKEDARKGELDNYSQSRAMENGVRCKKSYKSARQSHGKMLLICL